MSHRTTSCCALESSPLVVAYSLKRSPGLQSMQRASSSGQGLKQTHGLIGTTEWWEAIAAGALQLHTARGVIRGLWLGQWNDGPATFAMELEDGSRLDETCHQWPSEAASNFTLGRYAEVDFVIQHRASPPKDLPGPVKVCLEIRLGDTRNQLVEPFEPCYFTRAGHE